MDRPDVFDVERLGQLVGVKVESSDQLGWSICDTYAAIFVEALADGASEEEAEEAAREAEGQALEELEGRQLNALESAGRQLLEGIGLDLEELGSGHWRVIPLESWSEAARQVVAVLVGYGFDVAGRRDLRERGPYGTDREAVLAHLFWARERPNVYGTPSGARLYERALS